MKFNRKEYIKKYQREWLKKRKLKYFSENGPCIKCKSWVDLQIDHIIPEDKVASSIWSWKESKRLEELSKCQVLCKICHLEKTKIDNSRINMRKATVLRRITKKEHYNILYDYFIKNLSRRKVAEKYKYHHGTISHYVYGSTCYDWWAEFISKHNVMVSSQASKAQSC